MKAFRFLALIAICIFVSVPGVLANSKTEITQDQAIKKVYDQLPHTTNYDVTASLKAVNPPIFWAVYLQEKGKKNSYMEVHLDPQDGRIIYYSLSEWPAKTVKSITEKEAKGLALSFVKAIFTPEEYKQLYTVPTPSMYQYSDGSSYQFVLRRSIHGYPYNGSNQTLQVLGPFSKPIPRDQDLTQEEALKIVQNFASIDSSYKLKSSNKYYGNLWEFNWSVDDSYTDHIIIGVDSKTGEIHKYYSFKKGLPAKTSTITETQAKQIALEYIKRAIPSQLHRVANIVDTSPTKTKEPLSEYHHFQFPMIINSLPLLSYGVNLQVDGEGKVTSYEARLWSGKIPEIQVPIDIKEAQEIFNRRFLQPLAYLVTHPLQEPLLGYRIGERYADFFFIEAETGKVRGPSGIRYEEFNLIADTAKHWAAPEIQRLTYMGIIEPGYEKFSPRALVTRSQFVRALSKTLRINPIYPNSNRFSDVSRELTSFGYIEAIASANIVQGSEGGGFWLS